MLLTHGFSVVDAILPGWTGMVVCVSTSVAEGAMFSELKSLGEVKLAGVEVFLE